MAENNILQYKGQPLVKCGNKIYYGDPAEKCILVLTILEEKEKDGEMLPTRVLVQVQSTSPELELSADKILKEAEKSSLYDALEIGTVWLARELR